MRMALVVSLLLCAGVRANAQSAGDLQVPTAALTVLELPLDRGLPLAMSRAIRILHSSPHEDMPLPEMLNLEHLLTDLDRLEEELSRAGARGLSLAMAKTNTDRSVLKDALKVVGLKLREQRKAYSVDADTSKDAIALRERLRKAGIETASLPKRFNSGESIVIVPSLTALPLPLAPETWSSVVLERSVSSKTLFGAIIRDRRASLLYCGLQAMTPETLAYLSKNPDLLRHLYRDAAGPVAAFGGSFRIGADGRVAVRGGAEAVDLWEALVDETIARPDRFGRSLFSRDSGRLAYFFDTVARLDEPHRRFALGAWITDRGARLDRFRQLYQAFASVDEAWILADTPFARPSYDPATLLMVVAVTSQGGPAAPSFRKLWARALDGDDIPDASARDMREPEEDGTIDAAWLAEQITGVQAQERRVRIERLAFGQRLFGGSTPAELQDVLVALRGFARFPAAMFALERIGVRDPKVYAATARRARTIERLESPSESLPLLAQLQGGLAVLERLARTGAVGRDALEQLVASLVSIELNNSHYEGRVTQWVRASLLAALPRSERDGSEEDRLIGALADRTGSSESFQWEGETYALDDGRAQRDLKVVRGKQGGNSLDAILAAFGPGYALARESHTIDQIKKLSIELKTAASKLALPRPWPDAPDAVPEAKKVIESVARDLGRITKPQDAGRAAKEVEPMLEFLDYALGETLVGLAYASALGDAAAIIGQAADLSHRHTFGVGEQVGSSDVARRMAWRRPSPGSKAVTGDALTGSLFGIDLALSRKRLRRIASDRLPGPPRLNPNDAMTFVSTVALLNSRSLTSGDLGAIGAALTRGHERVAMAARDSSARDTLASDAWMSDARRQVLAWAADHAPDQMERLFSVSEIFWLGADARPIDVDGLAPWGMSHEPVTGCFCLGFPAPGSWDRLSGRQATNQLPSGIPDVNLRVAGLLSQLKVPAALFPGVMSMAMQDYIDTVPAMYADDWEAISAHAWQITRERVEDYVSALVANGPVRTASSEASR
jgi:hypothetical protein